jgi:hypothetical protein
LNQTGSNAGVSTLVADKVQITNAPIPSTGADPAAKIAAPDWRSR